MVKTKILIEIKGNIAKKYESYASLSVALVSVTFFRFGTSDECSGAVSFLASDDSSYITGETIIINGGLPSRL